MSPDRFAIGGLYFLGGYHDPEKRHPCIIRPVVFVGKEQMPSGQDEEEINRYTFEDLEAWLERAGVGAPDDGSLVHIDGPAEIMIVMDLDQTIRELTALKARLERREP